MALKFFVTGVGEYVCYGLSSDTKPATPPENSLFIEMDTGRKYTVVSSIWIIAPIPQGDVSGLSAALAARIAANDPRLSDARPPLPHTQTWSTITATPTTRAGYGITDAEVSGAAAAAQAVAVQRSNHTGTQAWSTITGAPTTLVGYGITDGAAQDIAQLVVPLTGQTRTFNILKKGETIACNHTSTIAAQTFVFPSDVNSQIGQELRVFSRSIITTVTLTTTGLTMLGTALTTLAANGNACWQKVGAATWVRVQ